MSGPGTFRPACRITIRRPKLPAAKHRLPKVVQKLLLDRPLTPEEKAELLWRFHELEHQRRGRRRAVTAVALVIGLLVALAAVAAYPPPWLRHQMSGVLGSVLQ